MGSQFDYFQESIKNLKSSNYPFDALMGSFGTKYVVMFERALWKNGLTYLYTPQLSLATLGEDINGLGTFAAIFINNPWFQWYDYTTPSPKSENILYPNAERALVDSIIFVDQCDQGVLIESLRNYYDRYKSWNGLHEMLKHYHEAFDHTFIDFYSKFKDKLNYWISEAEDYSNED